MFEFYFEEKKRDKLAVLRFNFKIFGQKCFTCDHWGSGSVIEDDLWNLTLIYSNIIEIVMNRKHTDLHKFFRLSNYEKEGTIFKNKRRGKSSFQK